MANGQWNNRIIGTDQVSPDQLLANPRNFRVHPQHQQDALEGVLNEVGWVDDVIVNQRSGFVIDGHLRITLAKRRGEMVPVKYIDLDDHEEALILATFDPIAALAVADAALLEDLLRDVSTTDAAVMQMLSDMAEREGIVDFGNDDAGLTDPDDVPEPPVDPITKPGDLWTLGRHRLLCGDSTNRADVDRLMNGEKADMVFTDPPYNTGIQQGRTSSAWGVIQNDKQTPESFQRFIQDAATSISGASSGDVYVCCDYRSFSVMDSVFSEKYGRMRSCIVWAKENFGLGSGYRRQHEFVTYWGSFAGNTESDLWNLSRDRGVDYQHPTQKPTALAERAITNSSQSGDTVLDLFGGSGSTLMACEQTSRECRMMELDPIYCDVIVQRWENYTGETASREPSMIEAVT